MADRPESAAVCVLGMSRSGTSVTARALDVLGVYLGAEEELMPAAAGNNPAGFWEHQGIADLNEEILAVLGEAPRRPLRDRLGRNGGMDAAQARAVRDSTSALDTRLLSARRRAGRRQ